MFPGNAPIHFLERSGQRGGIVDNVISVFMLIDFDLCLCLLSRCWRVIGPVLVRKGVDLVMCRFLGIFDYTDLGMVTLTVCLPLLSFSLIIFPPLPPLFSGEASR